MLLKGAPLTYDQKAALGARGGAAFQGSWNNQLIAVKVLEDNVEPSAVHQRTEIWKTLVHPNILEIFGASDHEENDPEHLQVVVTALYPAGNIRQYLASYPNVERPNIILQISAGLQFLHSRNIIHGSLKPSQILVRDDGSIVIGDYGMVELQPSKSKDGHRYWSPEAWKGGVTRPSDVFAFAMTAYELVTSSQPWGVLSEKVIYQMVAYEDTRPDRPDPQLELRVGLTEGMWGIIEEAWHKDPRLRPTFDMIVRLWTAELNGGANFSSFSAPRSPASASSSRPTRARRAPSEAGSMHSTSSGPPAYDAEFHQTLPESQPIVYQANASYQTLLPASVANLAGGAYQPSNQYASDIGLDLGPVRPLEIRRPAADAPMTMGELGSSSPPNNTGSRPGSSQRVQQSSTWSRPGSSQGTSRPSSRNETPRSNSRGREEAPVSQPPPIPAPVPTYPTRPITSQTNAYNLYQQRGPSAQEEKAELKARYERSPSPLKAVNVTGILQRAATTRDSMSGASLMSFGASSSSSLVRHSTSPSSSVLRQAQLSSQRVASLPESEEDPDLEPRFGNSQQNQAPPPGAGYAAFPISNYLPASVPTTPGWDQQSTMSGSDTRSRGAPSVSGVANAVLVVGALQSSITNTNPQEVDSYLTRIHLLASQSEKDAERLVAAGVVPILIGLLKSRAGKGTGLELVLIALGMVAHDPISANTISRTGTISTLIEVFSTFSNTSEGSEISQEQVGTLTLWCLTRICRSAEISSGMIKLDLPRLLCQKGLRSKSPLLQRYAAWCLGNLIYTDSIADTLELQHKVVVEVSDHLRKVSTSRPESPPEDICAALYPVARISRSIKLAKSLSKAGCIPYLTNHLNSSDPLVLNWTARVVGCLMRPNSSDMAKALLDASIAKGLARLPSVLPHNEDGLVYQGVAPLASFAFAVQRFSCAEWGGGVRKRLVEEGVVDSLLAALRTAADEPCPEVHIELALAVSFLGDVGGKDIRKEITRAGGIDILKKVAKEGSPEVNKACSMAVTSITGNLWTRNAASAKTAMSHNWSGGCPEYQPQCPFMLPDDYIYD